MSPTKNDPRDWVMAYFSKLGPVPDDCAGVNYFEAGFIDSFGVIELIDAIESEFGIELSESHYEDRRFATIDGLADIIVAELQKRV